VLGQEGGGGVGREAELGIREGAIAQFWLKIELLHLPNIYSPYCTCFPSKPRGGVLIDLDFSFPNKTSLFPKQS